MSCASSDAAPVGSPRRDSPMCSEDNASQPQGAAREQLEASHTSKLHTSGTVPLSPDESCKDEVDPAVADALKSQKNRVTVLRFEEDVVTFMRSSEEALYFPLSLSGYQRLLAHRTAQYYGLQTATVDDADSGHHGKIKATRPQADLASGKKRLSELVPDPPKEEPKEQAKISKKKTGERQSRRRREMGGSSAEAYRTSGASQRLGQNISSEREGGRFGSTSSHRLYFSPPAIRNTAGPLKSGTRGASQEEGGSEQLAGRPCSSGYLSPSALECNTPEYAAHRSVAFVREQAREVVSNFPPNSLPGSGLSAFGNLSLQPQGMSSPGFGQLQVPFAYLPGTPGTHAHLQHALSLHQGITMMPGSAMGYGNYHVPMPFGYLPARPGHQYAPPYLGQPLPGMVPLYSGFMPQQGSTMHHSVGGYLQRENAPSGSPTQSGSSAELGHVKADSSALANAQRAASSSSVISSGRSHCHQNQAAAASGSTSGDNMPGSAP